MAIKIEEKLEFPEGVTATVDGSTVTVTGPKGEVKRTFKDVMVSLSGENGTVVIKCEKATKREKARAYSYRAHIRNMIRGVTEGHSYELKICASHFPMNVAINNKQIIVKNFLGEKVPRVVDLKEGAEVKLDGQVITIESPNKEVAGQIAGDIEQLCRITNRDKRIFQDGIYITMKDGKQVN
jgi:large subunit ribosomal protein L6